MIPAIPAAAFKWPIWDLMDPTATLSPDATSVHNRVKVESSVASPTFVEVPCASTSSTEDAG